MYRGPAVFLALSLALAVLVSPVLCFQRGVRKAWMRNIVTVPPFAAGRDYILSEARSKGPDLLRSRSLVFSDASKEGVTVYIGSASTDSLEMVAVSCALFCFIQNEMIRNDVNPFPTGQQLSTGYQVETPPCRPFDSASSHRCSCMESTSDRDERWASSRGVSSFTAGDVDCVASAPLADVWEACNPSGTAFGVGPLGALPPSLRLGEFGVWSRDMLLDVWRGVRTELDAPESFGGYLVSVDDDGVGLLPGGCYCKPGWTGPGCEYDFSRCAAGALTFSSPSCGGGTSRIAYRRTLRPTEGLEYGSPGFYMTVSTLTDSDRVDGVLWDYCPALSQATPRCPVGACYGGRVGRFCQTEACDPGSRSVFRCGGGECTLWGDDACDCGHNSTLSHESGCFECYGVFSPSGEDDSATCPTWRSSCFDRSRLGWGSVSYVECSGHGECVRPTATAGRGRCVCGSGWGGVYCGLEMDETSSVRVSGRSVLDASLRLASSGSGTVTACSDTTVPVVLFPGESGTMGEECLSLGGRVGTTSMASALISVEGGDVPLLVQSDGSGVPTLLNSGSQWSGGTTIGRPTSTVFEEYGSGGVTVEGVDHFSSRVTFYPSVFGLCSVMPCRLHDESERVLMASYQTIVSTAFDRTDRLSSDSVEPLTRSLIESACATGCPLNPSGVGGIPSVPSSDFLSASFEDEYNAESVYGLGGRALVASREWLSLLGVSGAWPPSGFVGSVLEDEYVFTGVLGRSEAQDDPWSRADIYWSYFAHYPARSEAYVEELIPGKFEDVVVMSGSGGVLLLDERGVWNETATFETTGVNSGDRFWTVCSCESARVSDLVEFTRLGGSSSSVFVAPWRTWVA